MIKHKRTSGSENQSLFAATCFYCCVQNTAVSKEVYKYVADYEYTLADGENIVVDGIKELFSNYEPTTKAAKIRPPTLLIDSDALENGEQINEDFRKIFSSEIEEFKKTYEKRAM